ncbi:exodeoxyribonucleaseV alpha chain [Candidatus Photodesmus blepharus]|uniref:RecBCD enzyme subunit RecD n=1 Tax=Candidatus Photodesmus blepharonis TaxID=1179155 RepID=A0A084CP31_9GAMM|nr:exodeoxyribonuclease V subunit alpha [Candidatus Photodesmus blepharus]KEY91560.1 exodeoxyribonucleaseV alpha chain [Candidatus Photodesmus blepharus]
MKTLLMDTLQELAEVGSINQLDYQFARFVSDQIQQYSDEIGFIAGVVSHELSKGHVCLSLLDNGQLDLASKLGLYGDFSVQLNKKLSLIHWPKVLHACNLIGKQGTSLPLIFDGVRLYLHRYWQYETNLAVSLTNLAMPVRLQSSEIKFFSKLLNQLVNRTYHSLFNALITRINENSLLQSRQLMYEHIGVVNFDKLDWKAIDKVLLDAKCVEDLKLLDILIPESACINFQKIAIAIALSRYLTVISGGPGTGKTTIITQILIALIKQLKQQGITPIIKLVAPTGKAVRRLTESIRKAVAQLSVEEELRIHVPTTSSTIHSLLGVIPDRTRFHHNRDNPLSLDVLVVDEASMVDLPIMCKLIESLPNHTRLILLGDRDQLASVEAGAVLGDICSFYQDGFSPTQRELIVALTGHQSLKVSSSIHNISDSLCVLNKNYRFNSTSGINQLAKAINSGKMSQVDLVWQKNFTDIEYYPLDSEYYEQMLKTIVKEYGRYLKKIEEIELHPELGQVECQQEQARMALEIFSQCRLLCAVREGNFGVNGLNQSIESALVAKKLIQIDGIWYHGRPVMVTNNEYKLGIYNGDIGICLRDNSDIKNRLKVFFQLSDGSIASLFPSCTPRHETAYAMTIHKSQGSEFDLTFIVLPLKFSSILTRELIYTGVTRAKKHLVLYADANILRRGIKIKTQRASGLIDRLKELS